MTNGLCMEINTLGKSKDVVTVENAPRKLDLQVRLGVGGPDSNPRYVYLQPAEARAVAHALLCYAEQQQFQIDGWRHAEMKDFMEQQTPQSHQESAQR